MRSQVANLCVQIGIVYSLMVGVKELYVRAEQLVHACGQDFAADELNELVYIERVCEPATKSLYDHVD